MKHASSMSAMTTGKVAVVAAIATTGLAVTGVGVYASLNATASNGTPQAASSGTLKLEMAANGTGFGTAVSNLAPGDVINRHIQLTNSGTLEGSALTLGVTDAATTPSALSTDATKGLRAAVARCSVAWTASTGACGGVTTSLLASTAVSALRTTPSSVVAGALTAGEILHLQVKITLPDSAETTVNGVLPAGTIQGLTAQLTWNFNEVQRTATTTSS